MSDVRVHWIINFFLLVHQLDCLGYRVESRSGAPLRRERNIFGVGVGVVKLSFEIF